jgi:RNA polymerase sigma-70 factor (ECF subfamily)
VSVAPIEDAQLVRSLRAGDERAFAALVEEHGPTMLRVARLYVRERSVAEEVVQEAWVGLLRGIERFEGRSSLRTWLFRIVTNVAKTRALREARSVPFSALAEAEDEGPSVPPERFRGLDDRWAGHWASPPAEWARPDEALLSAETRGVIARAIEALPQSQREVVTLRDVAGWSAEEVCNALELTETNQRVLLHRARTKVREALDDYLREDHAQ